jgi:hypothetical protein
MSWQDDTRFILRTLSGDTVSPYEYDDTRLDDLLLAAARLVLRESRLADLYVINLTDGTVSPDPHEDNWFVSLVALKAWEILSSNEYRFSSNKAIAVRDGVSSIDGRSSADNKKVIAQKAAEDYKKAIFDYNSGKYIAGKAILGPFNLYTIHPDINTRR